MLSIGAVGFVVQAARAYGGEIAGGGVVVFAVWRLLDGASQILNWQRPPSSVESAVYLVATALLLAGFYMLWETMSGHAA
jgi:lipopolysaccharide export LptBFGC system permease protein LptF